MKHMNLLKAIAFFGLLLMIFPINTIHAQQPEYAKWGKIAVEETSKQFPDLNLVDYEYEGSVFISDERVQYNFEFTLETEGGEERTIHTYVLVNPDTEQLIDVYFDEIQDLN
ncbi:DUF3889 domain-containing protein [Virgibacillus byunsanensis]|uniref:DUF3889 domain-containing protein n=1 Tax=Virgibacillus byunsanensis TaxID=570945 RepID=A0ABW3LS14_9BACI